MTHADLLKRLREANEAEHRAISDAAALTAHADALEQALQIVAEFAGVNWEADTVPANLGRVLASLARSVNIQVDGPIPVGPSRKEAIRLAVETERQRCVAACGVVAMSYFYYEDGRKEVAMECAVAIGDADGAR
jgi:hypothetical protein